MKNGERCLSMRSPWEPQTMQKAESDVEQLAIQKSQLQARTEHMGPRKQLPSAPVVPLNWARGAGDLVLTVPSSFIENKFYNRNCCQPTLPFWSAIEPTLLFLQVPAYIPLGKHSFFFPLEASIFHAELSHNKSTIISLRNNK